jgi:hypothetical protein
MADVKSVAGFGFGLGAELSACLCEHLLAELSALTIGYLNVRPITWDTETGWANPSAHIAADQRTATVGPAKGRVRCQSLGVWTGRCHAVVHLSRGPDR